MRLGWHPRHVERAGLHSPSVELLADQRDGVELAGAGVLPVDLGGQVQDRALSWPPRRLLVAQQCRSCELDGREVLGTHRVRFQWMRSRSVALLRLLDSRMVAWVVEQPGTSILVFHPRFQQYLQLRVEMLNPCWTCTLSLKDFGGDTKKPTVCLTELSACGVSA